MYIHGGIVDGNFLFVGDNEKNVVAAVEKKFKEYAKEINSDLTDEEIGEALDNGGYDNNNGREVIINWPTVERVL